MVKLGSGWGPTEKEQQDQAVVPGWWARAEGGSKAEGAMARLTSGTVPQYLNKESRAGLGRVSQHVSQQASPWAVRQGQGQARKSWSVGQVRIGDVRGQAPAWLPPVRDQGKLPSFNAAPEWKGTASAKASYSSSSNSSLIQGHTAALPVLALSPGSQNPERGLWHQLPPAASFSYPDCI